MYALCAITSHPIVVFLFSVKTRRLSGATGSWIVFTIVVSGLTRCGFNLCVAPSYRNRGVL